jgi:hypothetical protein
VTQSSDLPPRIVSWSFQLGAGRRTVAPSGTQFKEALGLICSGSSNPDGSYQVGSVRLSDELHGCKATIRPARPSAGGQPLS